MKSSQLDERMSRLSLGNNNCHFVISRAAPLLDRARLSTCTSRLSPRIAYCVSEPKTEAPTQTRFGNFMPHHLHIIPPDRCCCTVRTMHETTKVPSIPTNRLRFPQPYCRSVVTRNPDMQGTSLCSRLLHRATYQRARRRSGCRTHGSRVDFVREWAAPTSRRGAAVVAELIEISQPSA
jgi:hypothetical protein